MITWNGFDLEVNCQLIKDRNINLDEVFEFFGEIDELSNGSLILRAKIINKKEDLNVKLYER